MSREVAWLVRLPSAGVEQLLADIDAAADRVSIALPGDRTDIIRFEALATELERIAVAAFVSGAEAVQLAVQEAGAFAPAFHCAAPGLDSVAAEEAEPWFAAGDVAVEIRLPFGIGQTVATRQSLVRAPAGVWRAVGPRGGELDGVRAVEKRFRTQIKAAIDGKGTDAAIRPSGINNRVLTEALHGYVSKAKQPPTAVPVMYRDGSRGPDFPLRCLQLRGGELPGDWPVYKFAMLSIRHTEMDAEVHGAWLRNADISQARQVGETDALAYKQSCEQLARLTNEGPAIIYLYQTGLEAAVLGVYRAVTQHLLDCPGSLAVVPMYYKQELPGAGHGSTHIDSALFVPGKVWRV